MLSDGPNLHLVTTDPDSFATETLSHFDVFGADAPSSRRGEFRALSAYLETIKPGAVVQLTYPPVHGSIVGLATRRFAIPFVYRYNGDRFREYSVARGRDKLVAFGVGNVLGRLPLRLSDHYIALGPSGKSRLMEYGVDESAITILPPSIHVEAFTALDSEPPYASIPDDRKIVLFVGRLSYLKGVKTLERTIPEALKQRPDLHFAFVGESEHKLTLPARCTDNVTVLGRVSPENVPAYYRHADVLVHPSLTEGVPRAVLESLAAGTPVLARDVGDVASVTDNTFRTDEEFLDRLLSLEDLPLDNVKPFARETLRPRYAQFFQYYC
jgi:glycosyltransferase involved in cell wall biosynthesis